MRIALSLVVGFAILCTAAFAATKPNLSPGNLKANKITPEMARKRVDVSTIRAAKMKGRAVLKGSPEVKPEPSVGPENLKKTTGDKASVKMNKLGDKSGKLMLKTAPARKMKNETSSKYTDKIKPTHAVAD